MHQQHLKAGIIVGYEYRATAIRTPRPTRSTQTCYPPTSQTRLDPCRTDWFSKVSMAFRPGRVVTFYVTKAMYEALLVSRKAGRGQRDTSQGAKAAAVQLPAFGLVACSRRTDSR